ncbi:MaoC family dehydratase [Variovorax sp. J22R133]|uniref:MaoC family dehydratase n=1 Tax=Variovorax brevis TaxID=3053503 RepID=UPI002577DAED|nr:MaoC family dehydratase [Variovorax sp. J22R133]MDM0115229.1 MaoC family dehydratase [Variovorax sp. J22R133]
MATLDSFVGKELGVSEWVLVDQQRINEFAHCTGDKQWIHVDVERANKESPFGAPVAHGFLTLSLLAPMGMEIGLVPKDSIASFNYGLNKVRFLAPVKVNSRLRARVSVTAVVDQGGGRKLVTLTNTMEIEGADKPALIAETLAVLVGAP